MTEFDVQVFDGFKEVSVFKFQRRNGFLEVVNVFGLSDDRLRESIWYALTEDDVKGVVEFYDPESDEYIEYSWEVVS